MQKSVQIDKTMDRNLLYISKYMNYKVILFSAIAFLLSRSVLMDSIAPLGIAFFIYVSRIDKYKLPVFISTLLGIVLSGNGTASILKYSACLIACLIISNKIKDIDSRFKIALIGALILMPISIGQALTSNNYIYDIFISIMEGIMLFTFIYIFSFGSNLLLDLNNKIGIRVEEVISISMLITFSIMGVGEVSIFGISIRTVLATTLILVAGIVGGASRGATTGVIVGVALMINDVTSSIYMGIYSFAGLVGGSFNKLNRYFSVLGYILSWVIMYAYTSGISSNVMELRDILIASLFVLLIPSKVFDKLENIISDNISSNEVVYDYIMRSKNITNNRLVSIYRAYDELSNVFDRIREKDRVLDQRDIANVIDMIHNDECRSCSMNRKCWEAKFNHTYTMMYDILEALEENGEIDIRHMPNEFRKECMKPEEIVKVANYYYKMFLIDYEWSVKFSESRKLVANQIRSISKSIENLTKDLDTNITLDIEKERKIKDELNRHGIDVGRVSYLTKDNDEFEISIDKKTCKDCCLCEDKLVKIVSDYVNEDLSAQKIGCHQLGQRCNIKLGKSQKYKIISNVSSMSQDGYLISGDNYTYMEIEDGKYMIALSDGMGKGKKAHEESLATIDILEKMVDAKIDNEIIISTINNMLLLKSSDEMFSTLDLGIVDLKKGILESTKMGSCSTYIKRESGDIDLISSSSLPVGIISNINTDRQSVKVKDGDYIIMVSDGIVDAGKDNNMGDNWLIYFLKEIKNTNPSKIADMILDRALEIQNNEINDDMTVIVNKVCLN